MWVGELEYEDMIRASEYGNKSMSGFKIEMKRFSSSFVYRYFIPLSSMVTVSFISFIVPPDVIPGRIALLITVFLLLITIFGDTQVSTSTFYCVS